MAILKSTMFREYDLRGLVSDDELNEQSVAIIVKAYGTMLRRRGILTAVVGHDFRTGSAELTAVALQALTATGIDAIFIGQVLTPMMYSAQYYYTSPGGIMVTASHNPNGWLGFKLALGYSNTLGPREMEELRQLTITEDFAVGAGQLRHDDYVATYRDDLVKRINLKRPIRVVINAGNGTAGPLAPDIFRAAGCEVVEYLTDLDLAFSHYFPNPSLEEMMRDTGAQTVKHKADLGIAFDGDGDRLGITDEKGQTVWPDQYMILLSRDVLGRTPSATIVYDVKCSRALGEDIIAHGGKPVMWKTGHSYIKEKLRELKAPLGGEMSGHIFFGEPIYYGFDDAVFAGLKVAELLSQSDASLSALIASTPNYVSTPTLQASCPDEIKYSIVAEVVESFKKDGYEVIAFGDPGLGGRVEFEYGWGLLRASSNLPALVLRFEAVDRERLNEIEQLIRSRLAKYEQVGRQWHSG